MQREIYQRLEAHMLKCMDDSAHDAQHIYRVLYLALELARDLPEIDTDVLIAACLLHDIGRAAQARDATLCHAREGAKDARKFLLDHDFSEEFAHRVSDCVRTHRYRSDDPPASLEAKVLFDADKLDVTGAIGLARTLLYAGQHNLPLYHVDARGQVLDGREGEAQQGESVLTEYHGKLIHVKNALFTHAARREALLREDAADAFYRALLRETEASTSRGQALLLSAIEAHA